MYIYLFVIILAEVILTLWVATSLFFVCYLPVSSARLLISSMRCSTLMVVARPRFGHVNDMESGFLMISEGSEPDISRMIPNLVI